MTITESTEFFKELLEEADSKRERKVYKSFIGILLNLKSRNFSDDELLSIQNEIKTLHFDSSSQNKRKFFNKKLNRFKTFLKDEYSLITEGYYTAIGMSLGMCFGVAFGSSLGSSGTSSGLAIGMLIGLAIGHYKDKEAEKDNRVLKTKMSSL